VELAGGGGGKGQQKKGEEKEERDLSKNYVGRAARRTQPYWDVRESLKKRKKREKGRIKKVSKGLVKKRGKVPRFICGRRRGFPKRGFQERVRRNCGKRKVGSSTRLPKGGEPLARKNEQKV